MNCFSMQTLELTLRDRQIKGQITDDDAFFFCSLFYNEREETLSKEGREQEAFEALSDRFAARLKDAESPEKGSEELGADLAFKVRREISHNWETRKIVTWRLLECFPTVPDDMIYWHSESRFGIRLDIVELVEMFMTIIGKIMGDEGKNKSLLKDTPQLKKPILSSAPVDKDQLVEDTSHHAISSSLIDNQLKQKAERVNTLKAELAELENS